MPWRWSGTARPQTKDMQRRSAISGSCTANGRGGLPQSDALAVEWFRKAADQGHAEAQCHLGIMYRQGKGGLPQSDALAACKAADGHAMAQYTLGTMYADGMGGLPQDFPEALRWLRKAHAQGLEQAAEEIEKVLRAQRQQQAAAAAASPPPPPPPAPSSSSPIIPIGTRVLLFGLKGKPELNGQPGVVTDFVAASGRLKVNLEDGRGPFSLLPKNLHEELD